MKVFISWSGSRSHALAKVLHEWIPMVFDSVEPWMSDTDINAGERWQQSIGQELEDSDFGILCLTPENIQAPWLLFEAGALAKSMNNARVVPLLLDLGVADINLPLSQFQAKRADETGFKELLASIHTAGEFLVAGDTI